MDSKYKQPKTLQQAIVFFSDPDRALEYMVRLRWPDGVVACPKCGRTDVVFLKTQCKWQCKSTHDHRQFSAKVGTIFEDSPIPLEKWLVAVWMLSNCRNGVSSYEMARAIGVTQKSAWFMLHRIRLGLQDNQFGGKLGGKGGVEVDETYIGGRARNMHKNVKARRISGVLHNDRTVVMGFLERGGLVRTEIIADRNRETVQPMVRKHVNAGAALYTDELGGYKGLESEYEHNVINHAVKYVDGQIHTNCLENFWSLLKRSLGGTYVAVEPFHLFRYVDEQAFRFNNRLDAAKNKLTDVQRFEIALSQVAGKRLTYAELTGKAEEEQVPF